MLVLELFSVQTNMKHNIRLGGGGMMVSTFILFQYYGVCTDLSPNTLLTQNMDFHAHQSPGIITMCMYAHVCRRVYLYCAFAAFEVTQCCVSPSGAFGRLSER